MQLSHEWKFKWPWSSILQSWAWYVIYLSTYRVVWVNQIKKNPFIKIYTTETPAFYHLLVFNKWVPTKLWSQVQLNKDILLPSLIFRLPGSTLLNVLKHHSIHGCMSYHCGKKTTIHKPSLLANFMGPTWGPSGADRTQVGPMLAPWTLLSGIVCHSFMWQKAAYNKYKRTLGHIRFILGCWQSGQLNTEALD